MKVGIVANLRKPFSNQELSDLETLFSNYGLHCLFEEKTATLCQHTVPTFNIKNSNQSVDLLVLLGGDGTILNLLNHCRAISIPIASINTGNLGFLTTCMKEETPLLAQTLKEKNFMVTPRALIEVQVISDKQSIQPLVALNEVTINRSRSGRIISLEVNINQHFLNHYRADGIICATPTGSTAYSLSAGGPIISPQAPVFLLTPICAHSLNNRSLVFSDSDIIEIIPHSEEKEEISLSVDGRNTVSLESENKIIIKKAAHTLPLVDLEPHTFFTKLHQKLRWHESYNS